MPVGPIWVCTACCLMLLLPQNVNSDPWEGRWASTNYACRQGDEAGEKAPFWLYRRRFILYEGTCAVRSIRYVADEWEIRTSCLLEGMTEKKTFHLSAPSSNRLIMREGRFSADYIRCGTSR